MANLAQSPGSSLSLIIAIHPEGEACPSRVVGCLAAVGRVLGSVVVVPGGAGEFAKSLGPYVLAHVVEAVDDGVAGPVSMVEVGEVWHEDWWGGWGRYVQISHTCSTVSSRSWGFWVGEVRAVGCFRSWPCSRLPTSMLQCPLAVSNVCRFDVCQCCNVQCRG